MKSEDDVDPITDRRGGIVTHFSFSGRALLQEIHNLCIIIEFQIFLSNTTIFVHNYTVSSNYLNLIIIGLQLYSFK